MRLVAIACVKNEIDIIEAFVRHTASLCDRVVVLDNGSTDGTLAVLHALAKAGLPLDVVEDPTPGHYQAQRMTRLMTEWAIGRHEADWVLALDADEFVVPPRDGDLRAALGRPAEPVLVAWRTWVPHASDDMTEPNPVVRMRHRLRHEARPWQKVIVPRRAAALKGASLSQGNHKLLIDGKRHKAAEQDRFALGHFPIRSPGQHGVKVAMARLGYYAMTRIDDRWSWHIAASYELLKRDPAAFAAQFRDAALTFAVEPGLDFHPEVIEDPLPYRGGPLAFTPAIDDNARILRTVLEYAEDMARLHARQQG